MSLINNLLDLAKWHQEQSIGWLAASKFTSAENREPVDSSLERRSKWHENVSKQINEAISLLRKE
ncbi:MAG TPA: hypothetical protein VFM18_04425 [Methanosarcina sp.]|nr:hypothetical protein [Methanosarcina sp.]